MSEHPFTRWHPHPDLGLERAIATADASALDLLLRHPRIHSDRYAHLRVLDRLHALQPRNQAVRAGWVQAMLLSNRPAQVWAVSRHWSYDGEIDPAFALIAAQVAQVMGESAEARGRYRRLLEQQPSMVDAWQKYFDFEEVAAVTDADIAQVESLHRHPSNAYVREKAGFALAGHYARPSPGRAFLLANEAHQLKRERLGSWSADVVAHKLEADRQRLPLPSSDSGLLRPVFVVGLPRSGTTLLTGLLDSHSKIAGLGEQNLIPSLADTACRNPLETDPRLSVFVGDWYRAAVGDIANDARVAVDKLPANVEHVGLILSMLPDAIVVHLEREFADCAMSIHFRDFEFGCRYGDRASDLACYAHQVSSHVQHWKNIAPDRVLSLRYEAIVEDPQAATAPLLSAVGLSWEAGMLDFWRRGQQVATFSEGQVRRPLNAGSIGSWRRFLPEAGDHLRALGVHV